MSTKEKVYRRIADSENLLQEFYENLEDDTFSGHLFIGEDDAKEYETSSSDSNIEEVVDFELKLN